MNCSAGLLKLRRRKKNKVIDAKLLAILACPACQGDVELKDNKIVCIKCGRKYPIKNGIPVLLASEAEK